ncbi:DUF5107 domain-containing protein [Escherichia coli]|nr:DUF5107 domain-containing protein [Escherichia coli]
MFLENRVYQGSSGAVYPYGVTDTLSEQKTLKSWQAVWLENDYIKVMILPELGGRVHRAWDKVKQRDFVYHNEVIKPALVGLLGPWISGGIEFNWPQHHRPTTFMPVDFTLEAHEDGAQTVWVSALIMIVLFALFVFISRKTAFGRSVFAVGGNATAAQLCGINVRRVRILIFTLSGLLAAVTGILLAARLGSGNAGAANGLEFDVIAAVVVGGTALSGGRGSLFGTLLGVLVITLIGNGLVLLGINSFFQQVVRGVIIVVAVLANILLTQRSSKAKR